jgi:hypothetical protein
MASAVSLKESEGFGSVWAILLFADSPCGAECSFGLGEPFFVGEFQSSSGDWLDVDGAIAAGLPSEYSEGLLEHGF